MTQHLAQLPEHNGLPGPGTIIGDKYRVDAVLGSGGMGVVLSATHLELDAAVAIKVVRAELANNEEVIARMLFEARAAAKLHGSHIVRVLDVGRLPDGAPYIVMERLAGCDLATLLSEGALPLQQAVDYVLQACEGLAEAHAAGIIHRDLKPENLFVAETPEGAVLKILDFGISKDIGKLVAPGPRAALTNAGYAVGSPYYMSPEQMRASLAIDGRADIWSLGAILCELLTGRCPFEGESLAVVCAKVLSDEAPSLHSLADNAPAPLVCIVARCLAKDPEQRFADVGKLATALREFASAEGKSCADRSARLASGINFKSERPARPTPVTRSDSGPACSSPTLQSLTRTPVAGGQYARGPVAHAVVVQETRPARPVQRAAFAALAALFMVAAGGTFWSLHSRAAAARADRGPRPQIATQAQPQPEVRALAARETPDLPPIAVPAPSPVAAPALPPISAASLSTVSLPPSAPLKLKRAQPAWPRPTRAAPVALRSVVPAPGPSLANAVADAAAVPVTNTAAGSPNAWDTDRLGGRY